ncbi:hypothetical protein [Mesorhizobium comanense]|uniref:hypothetical protein n=1 Tax=Mesorhizobium comanense TaxID=2502215 RepID=UPI0010F8AD19|nr:hypothetical protein [Mesorhizobium comanense]
MSRAQRPETGLHATPLGAVKFPACIVPGETSFRVKDGGCRADAWRVEKVEVKTGNRCVPES